MEIIWQECLLDSLVYLLYNKSILNLKIVIRNLLSTKNPCLMKLPFVEVLFVYAEFAYGKN